MCINSLQSCKENTEPESPEKLFEKYKGSVVLIASEFYYEIDSNDGRKIYYSPASNDKIYFELEDVLNNLSFSTGTGFIISNDGKIVTNNHVVNNKDENYKNELNKIYETIKTSLTNQIELQNDSIETIKYNYNKYYDNLYDYEKEIYRNKYDLLTNRKNELLSLYEGINEINVADFTSKLIIKNLGISFNNTHYTDFNDLQECIVLKTSDNEDIDLALIQTKNKTLNIKPKHIFNFNDNNPNIDNSKIKARDIKNPVKINQDVFMIGFNKGFSLAKTKKGIKSQFTSGKISQESDGTRILYTIPTLEGSSGSPIIDIWGNLVAVNFAKIKDSQSFSFGVPVNELKKFCDEY